ncbi:hypothetical protein QC763_117480 [Podospora pseudopauciseta]|uniref:Extracellular membrane protein CFEM domain-containing protein n=2 Tax=Podospora TaxID=5144 RepID=A0ABR0I1M9_9PEZI|nr:hypothetical protein QC763_117480 [Podospora pseudopauciseta]KAK4682594.1 hypothetical protein QC764_117480 [Podospora pseudoanserina]
MKSYIPLIALAAGVEATFKKAPAFTCPENIDNKCTPKQQSGFDWADLIPGPFANYGDFTFKGFECGSDGNKGRFDSRPGSGKFIGGTCHPEKNKSPSFGCGPVVDKFSLGTIVGCSDNTDAGCYCPDALFVKNVYDCLYAHGGSDQIISEAVIFFQGLCAPWAGGNPAVVTAPTVTTYLTITATPTVAPIYTTITIDTTTVVPCTDDAGVEIPGSSTTVVIATTVPVPEIGFTTGTAGVVDVVPITAAPIVDGGLPGVPGNNGGGAIITANGTTISVPTGTEGLVRPTQSVVLAGGERVAASFGLAAVVAAFAAFAL